MSKVIFRKAHLVELAGGDARANSDSVTSDMFAGRIFNACKWNSEVSERTMLSMPKIMNEVSTIVVVRYSRRVLVRRFRLDTGTILSD